MGRPARAVLVNGASAALQRLGLGLTESEISGRYLEMKRATLTGIYLLGMVLLILFLFAPMNTNPFVYFQF